MLLSLASPAFAHEERTVGKYHLAVGWGQEPTYAGIQNSVQVFLHDANDKAVTDLGETLKVTVKFQDQSIDLGPFEPNFETGEFGIPGDYRAWFIPTRPGTYTFQLTGSIKGQKVSQSFTSSDKTFDNVKDPSDVQFPAKDPSAGQLADRVTRDETRAEAIGSTASKGKNTAGTAQLLAIIGLAVGVIGFGTAIAATRKKA
jgi:hypothetical protein